MVHITYASNVLGGSTRGDSEIGMEFICLKIGIAYKLAYLYYIEHYFGRGWIMVMDMVKGGLRKMKEL